MFLYRNDVSKKKYFWKKFSEDNDCNVRYFRTKSGDANRLLLEYKYKNIDIAFNESDGKHFRCHFRIDNPTIIKLEISKRTFWDRLFRNDDNSNTFLLKNKIKSNNRTLLNSITQDSELLHSLSSSEFSGLYTYSKKGIIETVITATYFINNYQKLKDLYSITNRLIDKLLKVI